MTRSIEEILDEIAELPVMKVVELVKLMEDKFGVSAAVAAAAPAAAAAAPVAAEEKTEFDVVLTDVGDKKVNVIKVVRAVTGLAIKEAKAAVENVPSTLKEAVSKDDAESLKKQFEEAGAKVEIK